jgi:hypothetical protein
MFVFVDLTQTAGAHQFNKTPFLDFPSGTSGTIQSAQFLITANK